MLVGDLKHRCKKIPILYLICSRTTSSVRLALSVIAAVCTALHFQLVQRATAVKETSAAAVAAIVCHADESVITIVNHHAKVRGRAVFVGTRGWIGCTDVCRTSKKPSGQMRYTTPLPFIPP